MKVLDALSSAFGRSWSEVLQHLDDAVIVMDHDRHLQFANGRARALLGYAPGDRISGRCRHTTRGIDCELACPLTFALEQELESVRDFETTYRGSDGRDLPLRVTVIPLLDGDGGFSGAVEILRPSGPELGFFLSGEGHEMLRLRERLGTIARAGADLVLVGDRSVRLDVARTLHRIAGLDDDLFCAWGGSWGEVPPWPAGTRYADTEDGLALFDAEAPRGWRRIVGVDCLDGKRDSLASGIEVVELPAASLVREDLPLMIRKWAGQIDPNIDISAQAVQRLVQVALESGFEETGGALRSAIAIADETLTVDHLPEQPDDARFLERLLLDEDPLSSLESALLREVLQRSEWKMQDAADRLGVSRVTLWRKLKEYGIQKPG